MDKNLTHVEGSEAKKTSSVRTLMGVWQCAPLRYVAAGPVLCTILRRNGYSATTLALLSGFDMLAILSPFKNNNAACLTLVALTIQNWKKQWSLTVEMMRPLTSVLTVSMLTTIKDFTIQRRDVNYSLNSIRLLRIVITPSTRTSLKKLI